MKRLHALAICLVICALFAIAGCSMPLGAPKSASSGSTTGSSWTGTYMTTWTGGTPDVKMVLVQTGDTVTGTYDYSNGKITGTVQGNKLVGTWDEGDGSQNGPVEFDMNADGSQFSGWWVNSGDSLDQEKQNEPTWIGIRQA